MTAIASAQNGNWGTAATWNPAQVPTANDTVTINHTVTYDVNDDTNAIGDITVSATGTLQWTGGVGTKALRLAGNLLVYGSLIGRDGTFIRVPPTKAIWQYNQANAKFDFKGSVPNLETTLSAPMAIGDGKLTVALASGFGVGDPISVYDYTSLTYQNRSTEGFCVHAISGSDIYVRRRVGPTFTLADNVAIGSNKFVATADVRAWRNGMKFVIDMEVFTVSSTDAYNKIIYTTANAAATHSIGIVGYETGAEVAHSAGHRVYKLATILVAAATAGNNYVDVASSGGWAQNAVLAVGGAVRANIETKTIQSISVGGGANGSDRITFTGNLSNNHALGGLLVRVDRDCVIHGNTSDSGVSNAGYMFADYGNAAGRIFRLENVEFRYAGSNASVYYSGMGSRQYTSTSVYLNVCSRHAYKTSYNGMVCGTMDSYYYCTLNCVAYDTQQGIGCYGGYDSVICNGIAIAVNDAGYRLTCYDEQWATHNYSEGCGYGHVFAIGGWYRAATTGYAMNTAKHLISNYDGNGGFYLSNNTPFGVVDHISVKNCASVRTTYREWTLSQGGAHVSNIQSDQQQGNWETHDFIRSVSSSPISQIAVYDCVDFIPQKKQIRYTHGYAVTDETITITERPSWKFSTYYNSGSYRIGFFAEIWGLKGSKINIGAWLRKNAAQNGDITPLLRTWTSANVTLDSTAMSNVNDTWQWKTLTSTLPADGLYYAAIYCCGNAGNFWISNPMIDAPGCRIFTGMLESEWIRANPTTAGIRITGTRLT